VQCITAAKLAWFVMSAPNCGGLILILRAANWLINISQLLCFSRNISHSCRNTTLSKTLLNLPCCFAYIRTTAVSAPTLTRSFDVSPLMRNRDLRIAVVRIRCGGRDVIKSISTIRNKTAAWTEIIVTDANATSPCQKKKLYL
jgi:hypothetical protein